MVATNFIRLAFEMRLDVESVGQYIKLEIFTYKKERAHANLEFRLESDPLVYRRVLYVPCEPSKMVP